MRPVGDCIEALALETHFTVQAVLKNVVDAGRDHLDPLPVVKLPPVSILGRRIRNKMAGIFKTETVSGFAVFCILLRLHLRGDTGKKD
jgi:hypothetical protein